MVALNLHVGWFAILVGLLAGTILGLGFHREQWLGGYAVQTELFDVQITIQTPFPGTPLYERLRRAGRLLADGQWERCTLFDINYRPQPMTVDELRGGFHGLAERLYSDELTKWRRENFNGKYLRPARHKAEIES